MWYSICVELQLWRRNMEPSWKRHWTWITEVFEEKSAPVSTVS
jgi:hypothetical protein